MIPKPRSFAFGDKFAVPASRRCSFPFPQVGFHLFELLLTEWSEFVFIEKSHFRHTSGPNDPMLHAANGVGSSQVSFHLFKLYIAT